MNNSDTNKAEQLRENAVRGSVFKIMSGTSELERFRSKDKADEVCAWYRKHGFPCAIVVETDR